MSVELTYYISFVYRNKMNIIPGVTMRNRLCDLCIDINKLSLILSNDLYIYCTVTSVLLKRIVFAPINDFVCYYEDVRNDWVVFWIINA